MSTKLSTFLAAMRDVSPIMLGVIPFGLICGAVGVSEGMPDWGAIGFSVIIFAGAAQLAAIHLMADHASVAVIILTGLIINARFYMYSASIAPHFKGVPPLKKLGLGYMLSDQSYAISITRFSRPDSGRVAKIPYFLGAATLQWICFNGATVLGACLGSLIPTSWNLDFAVPLTFTALVIPAVKDRPTLFAAVVAGFVSLVADPLPYNLGLITAAMAGIAAGYALERRQDNG